MTVVWPASKRDPSPGRCRHSTVACSHHSIRAGAGQKRGTSPEPTATAVSSSPTVRTARACDPGSICTSIRYGLPGRRTTTPLAEHLHRARCPRRTVIDQSVLERTLSAATARGGEFRRDLRRGSTVLGCAARRRQDRGAVVGTQSRGPVSGCWSASRPASPTPPTCPSRACSPPPRPRPTPHATETGGVTEVDLTSVSRRLPQPGCRLPRHDRQAAQGRAARARQRLRSRRRRRDLPGLGRLWRRPAANPDRQQRRSASPATTR